MSRIFHAIPLAIVMVSAAIMPTAFAQTPVTAPNNSSDSTVNPNSQPGAAATSSDPANLGLSPGSKPAPGNPSGTSGGHNNATGLKMPPVPGHTTGTNANPAVGT